MLHEKKQDIYVLTLWRIFFFYVLLTVNLSIILGNDELDAQLHYFTYVYYNPRHVSSICSKHVDDHNKRIVKQSNCVSSWSLPNVIENSRCVEVGS